MRYEEREIVMKEIREIISKLLEVKSYACNIKTSHTELFLIINQKDEILSWYKSDNQEPFILETKDEIVRLVKPDIKSIRYRPVSEFRSMIEPVLYALSSPQGNFARSFLMTLILVSAGIFVWAALKGQSVTAMTFMLWFKPFLSFISSAFAFAFFLLGLGTAFKASGQIARAYWEKHNLLNSLAAQALTVGALSMFIPALMDLIALYS